MNIDNEAKNDNDNIIGKQQTKAMKTKNIVDIKKVAATRQDGQASTSTKNMYDCTEEEMYSRAFSFFHEHPLLDRVDLKASTPNEGTYDILKELWLEFPDLSGKDRIQICFDALMDCCTE